MRNYKNKITNITKFIVINTYFLDTIDNISALVKILIEVYLIENLKVNMLIETNVFTLYKFLLNCDS